MSRLQTLIATIDGILKSAQLSPRCTLDALKLLPSIAQGLHYGRSSKFPSPPQGATSAAPGTNPLLDYFNSHTEGPGLWKWLHYFDIYHRHFHKFVGQDVHVVEVGIYSGGSLGMWRKYFGEGCHIYGVDIEPACMTYKSERVDVFIGDQSDRNFWNRFRETVPRVDILIDDGGHTPEQQRITLEEMLPHLQPGGVYLCEDVGGVPNGFTGFVAGLASNFNAYQPIKPVFDAPATPTPFQAAIGSITQYPFVTVLEKPDVHPPLFVSEKHGTQWQPY